MTDFDFSAYLVTLKLASVTTVILLAVGIPLGWWLARSRSWLSRVLEALVLLPLVLPPTVVGFYLLLLLGPSGPVGAIVDAWNLEPLVFSFQGLVIGSFVYSLPFVLQPITSGFALQSAKMMDAAAVLRASSTDAFISVAIPMNRTGIITAAILGFAHTIGEFGVVLMIGGAIPGKTRVLSVAIFSYVEAMEYGQAHRMAITLVVFAFATLMMVNLINKPSRRADVH
jgi:molybdate transport system permease protein